MGRSECQEEESKASASIIEPIKSSNNAGRRSSAPAPSAVGEEKFTEGEWLHKYRLSLNETVLMVSPLEWCADAILHARQNGDSRRSLPVIDCGATSSVVGSSWLDDFGKSFPIRNKTPENRRFKFGGDKDYVSKHAIEIGLTTEVCQGKKARIITFWIKTSILDGLKIPLLISRSSLEKIQGRIDFTSNMPIIPLGTIKLGNTAHGHLLWPALSLSCSDINQPTFLDSQGADFSAILATTSTEAISKNGSRSVAHALESWVSASNVKDIKCR